ncbi:PA domain-containing protein, partial [Vibrio cholerae]
SQGYQESVDYIIATMKELGYEVTTQEFDFRSWAELGGTKLNVAGVDLISAKQVPEGTEGDFSVLSYAGSSNGELTGELVFITPDFDFSSPNYDGSDGCEASDFTGIDLQGKIAVIQRGTCGFSDKVVNAQKAGAKAVIVFNQGNSAGRTGLFSGTLSNTSTATIPAFGVTFQLGKNWFDAAQSAAIPVTLTLNVDDKMIVTQNVLAETRKGNPDQIVMLGAHLDSVPE